MTYREEARPSSSNPAVEPRASNPLERDEEQLDRMIATAKLVGEELRAQGIDPKTRLPLRPKLVK